MEMILNTIINISIGMIFVGVFSLIGSLLFKFILSKL